ncbi:uncharacterized protein LOC129762983 [Toxorhynchites rutilus septentrionalis]|uniref:uncharacterized protein LOC129762983 n=1 Tax=Toxorhynchites rutilus septentrionalis TaxID=329112 RepID=UPI0024794911|nr:uncharacterized protein LOC129762983 [Toxorhynchites rutilus septentrionalis]
MLGRTPIKTRSNLLHNYLRADPRTSEKDADSVVTNSLERECNIHQNITNKGMFRVVPVIVYGSEKHFKTFAFLDVGSSLTLIDAALATELNLNGKREPLCLKWTGNKCRVENESMMLDIQISGTGTNHKQYRLQGVHTVSSLDLFHQTVDAEKLAAQYKHLRGIPMESYENVQPRLLIGIDNAILSYALKGREGEMYEPVATKTRLGWVVHGGSEKHDTFVGHHTVHTCPCLLGNVDTLEHSVQEYLSLEGIGITKPAVALTSKEDQRALQILKRIVQTDNGHYETHLLWKYDKFRLPNSKPVALRRFYCLEARMKREPALAAVLRAQIDDYRRKGYIRKLTKDEELKIETQPVWYIPIFPVFNPNKPNKVRIVWDCAAETRGISLNSMLLKGPDQVIPLDVVLYKFRENKVGLSGDIREMFLQVLIAKADQSFQLFLWKDPEDEQPSTNVAQVMTFGASCSPSCAQYVKNLNADKYAVLFPRAVEAITKRHYVDDMLVSVETEEEAIQLACEVRHIHAQGGFDIRNWISNSSTVLHALEEKKTDEKSLHIGAEMATEKVLGMWWCTATDNFTYKLSRKHDADLLAGERKPTKREVLRMLMSIFDPLGLISNVLIILKILFQEVWRSAIGWDDEIPNSIHDKWDQWLQVLAKVKEVSIPRCYRYMTTISSPIIVQLHTFVDASELGYAAVVYLRFEQGNTVECMIVGAKSRVAPLKFVSIPRLELQSAMIGARLANTISKALTFNITEKFYWTDARDVLCWIRSDHRQYSVYVGWRVSEILETTDASCWKWVCSKDNVADEATKWKRQLNIRSDSRWIRGPNFLWQAKHAWPTEPFNTISTTEKLRAHLLYHNVVQEPLIQVDKFSSWHRLMRIVATVLRFVENLRYKARGKDRKIGPLTNDELRGASNLLYRQTQSESFPDETAILFNTDTTEKRIPKSSSIFNLNPFLDNQNVMRMHGRIHACEYASTDARNPVILPKDHHITKLIVNDYHCRYHHRNHETVLNELRQVFRIQKLRVLYRKVRANCQLCKNQRASPQPPPMGDLPRGRLAAFTRPFSFIGIDYFGPLSVAVGRRIEKRWGVLITCLTIRAVHLKIAHSMDADSCIKALRNFMARRGVPIKIYSDQGTNFIAANKELKAALKEIEHNKIIQEIVSPQTEWEFLPPASPHMGSSWERLVQTVKINLQQMKPGRNPSDETLRNLLAEIENLINSRPLTHVPVDDPDAPVLTPNHFILGSSSGLKPGTCLDDSAVVLRRSWRASQVEANIFWRRWVRDYLPELTRRTKWFNTVKSIEINDVVIVIDPELPRNCWPKGRIISVNQGKDGQVRSATVQTKSGIYERPATKIAVLDVRREEPVSQEPGVRGGSVTSLSVGAPHRSNLDRAAIGRD